MNVLKHSPVLPFFNPTKEDYQQCQRGRRWSVTSRSDRLNILKELKEIDIIHNTKIASKFKGDNAQGILLLKTKIQQKIQKHLKTFTRQFQIFKQLQINELKFIEQSIRNITYSKRYENQGLFFEASLFLKKCIETFAPHYQQQELVNILSETQSQINSFGKLFENVYTWFGEGSTPSKIELILQEEIDTFLNELKIKATLMIEQKEAEGMRRKTAENRKKREQKAKKRREEEIRKREEQVKRREQENKRREEQNKRREEQNKRREEQNRKRKSNTVKVDSFKKCQ